MGSGRAGILPWGSPLLAEQSTACCDAFGRSGAVWSLLRVSHSCRRRIRCEFFFFYYFFSPLGVEQQCVCWFINIEVLQSWGSPFLSRLKQQQQLLSISTLPALEEAGRERESPCQGGSRGVPTCSKIPSCPPGERRQPDSALGQSGGQGCLYLPSLQHPGGGRAHHAPARPR